MLEMIKLLEEDVNAVDTKLLDVKKRLLESSQLITMINRGTDENNLEAMHRICEIVLNNLNYILVYEYQEFDSMVGKVLVGLEDIKINAENDNTPPKQVNKSVEPEDGVKTTAKRGRKPKAQQETPEVNTEGKSLEEIFG